MAANLITPDEAPDPDTLVSQDYATWLREMFPSYVIAPFADRHRALWKWVWELRRGYRPRPFVGLWPRGGAKSTSAELACVALGARGARKYVLYVSGKQAQADDHVMNVANMLESDSVVARYPEMADRKVGKYGTSQGWRRNRVRTASGFTVDAIGLDVSARGAKLDEDRPDLIIFDDVDDTEDSPLTVQKKVRAMTQKLLPAGSNDAATLFIQNLVHYESIAARLAGLASVEADFLADRIISGPYPALVGFKAERIPGTVRHRITSGTPTWEGQNRETCQSQVDDWGIRAFRAEAQHERTPPEGQAFPEWDASVHVVDDAPIPDTWSKWRAIDYGYAAPFACLWIAKSPDGTLVVYRELYGTGMTATEQAKRILVLSGKEAYRGSVGDPSMWAKTREGKRFKSISDQYKAEGLKLRKATNDRLAGKERIHQYLTWDEGSETEPGHPPRLVVQRSCVNLIRTLPMLPKDPNDPEDVDTDAEDHCYDAIRYGVMAAGINLRPGVLRNSLAPKSAPRDPSVLNPTQTNASERAREAFEAENPTPSRQLMRGGQRRRAW